jgi:hypothetical protein
VNGAGRPGRDHLDEATNGILVAIQDSWSGHSRAGTAVSDGLSIGAMDEM